MASTARCNILDEYFIYLKNRYLHINQNNNLKTITMVVEKLQIMPKPHYICHSSIKIKYYG